MAGFAISFPEHDRNSGVDRAFGRRAPGDGALALGTAYLLVYPIHLELLDGVSAFDLALPTRVVSGRAKQDNALLRLAANEQLGVDVAGIDQVFARSQVFINQRLLDRSRAPGLVHRGRRRMDMSDEMNLFLLARLAQVSHITGPTGVTFGSVARLRVIGRFDSLGGRGQLRFSLEPHAGRLAVRRCPAARVMALPNLAQRLDDRHRPQRRWRLHGFQRVQQRKSVLADGLGIGLALSGFLGQPAVLNASGVAFVPGGRYPALKPLGRQRSYRIERGPERLSH